MKLPKLKKRITIQNSILLYLLIFSILNSYGQDKPLLVFDLVSGTMDSITHISYDTTIGFGKTTHYTGSYDSNIENLEQNAPNDNVFPNTQFTLKKKVVSDYDINSYPIRTSVKMFFEENDTLVSQCSGSLISKRHVLTAAHCISEINTNDLKFDSIYICPIFNNGNFNPNFGCSYVTKIFFFKNWKLNGEDLAVLELAEPIGESTGWISIGFDDSDTQYLDDIFYKFSYPGVALPFDPIPYNGDTLYYNYGKINIINEAYLGVSNSIGIPGESGSSITSISNNESYTTYGVLSYGPDLLHSRLRNKFFYPIQEIIEDDLVLDIPHHLEELNFALFPNPANKYVYIKNLPLDEIVNIMIYDTMGRIVLSKPKHESSSQIDLSGLAGGNYYLKIITSTSIIVRQFVKIGD